MKANVVINYINKLNEKYGKDATRKEVPLTVTRGKKHDYLGMLLDYSTKGKVKIDMREYLKTIFSGLPEGFDGTAATPAGDHLFTISEESTPLNIKRKYMCHHVAAQLLFFV